MQQLVGLACLICQRPVGSIVEGRFCEGCGSPVHKDCAKPPAGQEAGGNSSRDGFGQNQAFGISISPGCDNFVVVGNVTHGNRNPGINNQAGTGNTKILQGNIPPP